MRESTELTVPSQAARFWLVDQEAGEEVMGARPAGNFDSIGDVGAGLRTVE